MANPSEDTTNVTTLPELQANQNLWYKIKVLLHDLHNIADDRKAESRTLSTTDELYISAPYFTLSEAVLVKTVLVLPPVLNEIPEFATLSLEAENERDDVGTSHEHPKKEPIALRQSSVTPDLITVEKAIKSCLEDFFEKRRASGDARPCGPHDMGPIYLAVFGIAKEELKDEKFLSRLRRAGLPRLEASIEAEGSERKSKKRGKKGR